MLEVRELTVTYEGGDAVQNVSFAAAPGEWVMLIGPNGAGKSTLLAAMAQCAAYRGSVLLDGRDARQWKPRAFARSVGVLAQTHAAEYAFTVGELVSMAAMRIRAAFSDRRTRTAKRRCAAPWMRPGCPK